MTVPRHLFSKGFSEVFVAKTAAILATADIGEKITLKAGALKVKSHLNLCVNIERLCVIFKFLFGFLHAEFQMDMLSDNFSICNKSERLEGLA